VGDAWSATWSGERIKEIDAVLQASLSSPRKHGSGRNRHGGRQRHHDPWFSGVTASAHPRAVPNATSLRPQTSTTCQDAQDALRL
jgi:hypothetical protein